MKPVLEIDDKEEVILPEKYYKINNLCAIIYDQLLEIYKEANYNDLLTTFLNVSENTPFIEQMNKGEIHPLDWLKKNELNSEIEIILTKQIILAVVSDFINFMFESMYNAKRGNMTVAYALLRKPLTDELLIFEQLLIDRADFINRFYHKGNPEDYDPSDKNLDKLKIIDKVLKKIKFNMFSSSKFIYDLRYNKECNSGINGISNHALHIVTRDKNYKTLNQNFNFVFSQRDDIDEYYKHYYNLVPYLLIYSVSVIDEIIFEILKDDHNQNIKIIKEFRRFVGLVLLSDYTSTSKNNNIFKKLSKLLVFTCPNCKKKNRIQRADYELFFQMEIFLCSKCFENLLSTKKSIEVIENALYNGK